MVPVLQVRPAAFGGSGSGTQETLRRHIDTPPCGVCRRRPGAVLGCGHRLMPPLSA
jgi:hypothetical protein